MIWHSGIKLSYYKLRQKGLEYLPLNC